jgi:hypothetical protein
MLGWQIIVRKESAENSLASWTSGLGGTDWLDKLVKEGRAKDLGGNGYPNNYSANASEILPLLTTESINSIGGANTRLKTDQISNCSMDATLIIEAWDQS